MYKRYAKFENAWNQFAGMTIRDGNVEGTIPHMSLESKMIYCCLTSSSSDNENYIFFLLLKYLAIQQNKLLAEAELMMSKESEFSHKEESKKQHKHSHGKEVVKKSSVGVQRRHAFPKVPLFDFKSDLMVYFRENPAEPKTQASKKKVEDQEKEKLEKIISKNSSCKFEYGQGKMIEYNFAHIKKAATELLLQGKSKVDCAQKITFQFINAGNLFTQFNELNKLIPQESIKDVANYLKVSHPDQQDVSYR